MTDVDALIAEARGFIAGSDPDSARTTLIRDLANALDEVANYRDPSSPPPCTVRTVVAESCGCTTLRAIRRDAWSEGKRSRSWRNPYSDIK